MHKTTQKILNLLTDLTFIQNLNNFFELNARYTDSETTCLEASKYFSDASNIIQLSIEANIFDNLLTYSKRNAILSHLSSINEQLTYISKYSYTINHPNAKSNASAIIKGVIGLKDAIEIAKLYEAQNGYNDYVKESNVFNETRKEYQKIIKAIGDIEDKHRETRNNLSELQKKIEETKFALADLNKEKKSVNAMIDDLEIIREGIKRKEQEIEDNKIRIVAFGNNVNDNEAFLLKAKEQIGELLSKEALVLDLIKQAEQALNLKSAEGISAAFSSYLDKADKKYRLVLWLIGAGFFVLIALAITAWIITGFFISNPDAISSIAGRIIAVAITITGATFCAKQYVKQKNIIEDYAYKAVLAKSIIAFTSEIKKSDPSKVADYLTQVLSEIHQDPLRYRGNKQDEANGLERPSMVENALVNGLKN